MDNHEAIKLLKDLQVWRAAAPADCEALQMAIDAMERPLTLEVTDPNGRVLGSSDGGPVKIHTAGWAGDVAIKLNGQPIIRVAIDRDVSVDDAVTVPLSSFTITDN